MTGVDLPVGGKGPVTCSKDALLQPSAGEDRLSLEGGRSQESDMCRTVLELMILKVYERQGAESKLE